MSTIGQKNVEFSFTEKPVQLFQILLYRINELQAANFQCIQYLISTTLDQAAGVYCLPIIKFSFLAADSCKSSETELDGEVEEEVPSFPCSLITVAKDPKKKGTT